ncbi:MAG: LysR substrate-binding domain-containing protein [Hydrogenophaga sp.]|uniref:LysR family transcriptional regulator n=1 Tax=Hydrogenophaga sp. TaxID=1904254 RepID=UPI0027433317|nr:LysR substrate-binding domain-containing protein [Hydrogenophaga sp.]MDP2418574.1 LysR substrate-binding domain-containing protein [Hydrogenophaga sp.]MDZ4188697.1 LysR substrate-binding domain-containing protein [Hydrogenophaga sp.]
MTKKTPELSATRLHQQRQAQALDANALELFARVVEAGSFSRAARQLGLTRAAISRRVASMEQLVGQPLLARTTRSLGLTEAGRALAGRARAVHEAADAARMVLRKEGDALQGRLRITTMRAFGHSVLLPLLADFGREHPGVAMELLFTERRVDLIREGVDVAFRVTRKPPEDCVAQPVLRFRIGAYAAAGPVLHDPQGLQARPMLMLEGGAQIWPLQWRRLQDDHRTLVELPSHISADNLEALVELARRGQGVVLAPDFCVRDDVAAGRLLNLLPDWELPIAEGDRVQALTLPVHTAGANARALVRMVAQRLGP